MPESNSPDPLPPEVHASPIDVAPGPEAEDLWWKPSWADMARALGWHWVLMLPAAGIVALCVSVLFNPRMLGIFWWFGLKGIVWGLGIPAVLTADVIRRAAGARKDPFCIHCGYTLTGLPERGRCPECGSGYSRQLIDEYRRDPQWFIQRYKARKKLPPIDAPIHTGHAPVKRRKSRDGT